MSTDLRADLATGQGVNLPVRTTDPPTAATGYQCWIRSDLNSGDKIATLRWSDGVDVPIFPTSASFGTDVYDFFQVPVGGQMGVVPMAQATDAAYPGRRLPWGGTDYAMHDALELSAIPDSGVARWEFEQDVTDSWGDNDGTDNTSEGYSTDAQVGSYSKAYDGIDDEVTWPTVSIGDDFTLTGWFSSDDVSATETIYALFDGYWHKVRTANGNLGYGVRDGSQSNTEFVISSSLSNNTWYFFAATYASNGDMELYLNDANSQGTNNHSYTDAGVSNAFGRDRTVGGREFDGLLDDPRIYSKVLSSTEVSNLYNTGSIIG